MRIPFEPQLRLGCTSVLDVQLNTNCRDETIPILAALQHIYGQPLLRDEILDAVQHDVNANSGPDRGRTGMDYWSILVLGSFRLGCNVDYDKLQNLA